ncbi:MAG TPA: arginine deiminase-related protein [Gallionellaceae bacterium]|nr:arginine deiminase-related protein [Gallionellaceae bacterium]
MKTFLMCGPRYFDVIYDINPWMSANIGKVDKPLAIRQWQRLRDALSQKANIRLIEPVAGLPDMVFTANAGLVNRRKEAIVSAFRHPERQGESQHYKKFFQDNEYQIIAMPAYLIFEGAGDALFDADGELWFGSGPRSDAAAVTEISSAFQVKINSVELVDPRWYHLDTAFCPLSDGYVLAYKKAFSADSVAAIQHELGDKVIWISDEDANNFACNAVCLDHEIILYRASGELKATLQRYNFTVIEIDVSEFIKSGGSCKCMTLEI